MAFSSYKQLELNNLGKQYAVLYDRQLFELLVLAKICIFDWSFKNVKKLLESSKICWD